VSFLARTGMLLGRNAVSFGYGGSLTDEQETDEEEGDIPIPGNASKMDMRVPSPRIIMAVVTSRKIKA